MDAVNSCSWRPGVLPSTTNTRTRAVVWPPSPARVGDKGAARGRRNRAAGPARGPTPPPAPSPPALVLLRSLVVGAAASCPDGRGLKVPQKQHLHARRAASTVQYPLATAVHPAHTHSATLPCTTTGGPVAGTAGDQHTPRGKGHRCSSAWEPGRHAAFTSIQVNVQHYLGTLRFFDTEHLFPQRANIQNQHEKKSTSSTKHPSLAFGLLETDVKRSPLACCTQKKRKQQR